jgi:hypothetical protein
MARPYFTLVSFDRADETPTWTIEFGDYNREAVEFERDDMRSHEPALKFKILRTADARQATIVAAVIALNANA